MNIKRVINQKLYIVIISILILNFSFIAGSKLFTKFSEFRNQKIIEQRIEMTDSHEPHKEDATAETVTELLKLKNLSSKQKSELYNKLAFDLYIHNRISDFLEIIGYTIFYNELCGNIEQTIYYYALLAQYYLELGADRSAYEMILTARRIRNFYSLQDPIIRSQALHAYARFLVSESDFEDAKKALAQMEEDAAVIEEKLPLLGLNHKRRALAFKAYIMMQEGNIEGSYELAKTTLNQYYTPEVENDHISVYDFLLPIYNVRTEYAIRTHDYKNAIEFNKKYGRITKKFGFLMKKTSLTKELMFALPPSMAEEREELFYELAVDTDAFAQTILGEYTGITSDKLLTTIDNLKFNRGRELATKSIWLSLFAAIAILCLFILILLAVYSETQIDGLTKLRNRRSLNIRIGKLAAAGKRYSAIMIDIDNFKKLNDGYGHAFGDEVLKGVGAFLISNEARNVRCYRYGGEEMVVLLEHFDLEHAVRLSEHIRNEISMMKWSKDVHVTASFGLGYEMPDSIKEADENMYVAKQKGKNFTAYKKDGVQYLAERRLDIREPISDKF